MKNLNKNKKDLKVVVVNKPTKQEADEIIKRISQNINAVYSNPEKCLLEKI